MTPLVLIRVVALGALLLSALTGPTIFQDGWSQPAGHCRWPGNSVSYVDQSGAYGAATLKAAQNWSDTAASVSLHPASSAPWVVIATDMGANDVYGYTFVSCSGGVIRAAVSLYNTHYTDGFSFWQRVSVMTHEMGHGLGLAHARQYPPCPVPIMDANLSETIGLCRQEAPQAEDVTALEKIYGARPRAQLQGGIGSR